MLRKIVLSSGAMLSLALLFQPTQLNGSCNRVFAAFYRAAPIIAAGGIGAKVLNVGSVSPNPLVKATANLVWCSSLFTAGVLGMKGIESKNESTRDTTKVVGVAALLGTYHCLG